MSTKFIFVFLIFFPMLVNADGLLRTSNLDKYCQVDPGSRQTIIYLDQNIIASKDPNWYKDLINKVEYRAGEKIQIVNINDGGSTVELIWETCHPSVTEQRLKELKDSEGVGALFTGGVVDNLASDKKFFDRQFVRALSHPVSKTRHETAPTYDKASFPVKKLVEAIYYDSKRVDVDDVFSRVIIFSDMIENSELFDLATFDPISAADTVSKRYPMFLNYASFQIYGINYTNRETRINENVRDFWNQYLLLSGAYVEQYGAQLAIGEETSDWQFYKYKGHVNVSNVKGAASYRMIVGDDGKIHHGWLEIADMFLPMTGEVSCSGQNCKIDAKVLNSANKVAFRSNDVLRLKGTMLKLNGTVGGKDESVIDAQGNPYQHPVILSKI
jgi:hypothetical protein